MGKPRLFFLNQDYIKTSGKKMISIAKNMLRRSKVITLCLVYYSVQDVDYKLDGLIRLIQNHNISRFF
jgi:hypothetical protein